MKKLLLACLIFSCLSANANELTEDYLDIAASYCTYGNYKEAMDYLNKLSEINPSDPEIKNLKETVLRVISSEKSYLTSTNKNIREFEYYKKEGNSTKQINSLASATSDFWSNYILAQYYKDNNDLKNALFYYQKAINIKPGYSQSYLGIAQTFSAQNDFENALKYINKYITYNSQSDLAYAIRADINLHLNNITQAKEDIKKAIEKEENLLYLLTEAKIFYAEKNYQTAKDKLTILAKNIQTSQVYKYLALCDYETGNYENALLNLDKAIILSDDDKSLHAKYNEIKSKLEKK